jgi:hypothetical protein
LWSSHFIYFSASRKNRYSNDVCWTTSLPLLFSRLFRLRLLEKVRRYHKQKTGREGQIWNNWSIVTVDSLWMSLIIHASLLRPSESNRRTSPSPSAMPSASQFWCQMSNVDICSDFIKISYLGWGIDLGTWETADTLSVGTFLWFRFWWMVVPSLVPTLGSSHVTFNSNSRPGRHGGLLLVWHPRPPDMNKPDISWHLLASLDPRQFNCEMFAPKLPDPSSGGVGSSTDTPCHGSKLLDPMKLYEASLSIDSIPKGRQHTGCWKTCSVRFGWDSRNMSWKTLTW